MNSNNENIDYIVIFEAVFIIGLILNIGFAVPLLSRCPKIDFINIDSKLNPNTATVYELGELPSIGEKKAQAVVEYRQSKAKAFKAIADIDNVNGIGEKTSEKLEQWLVFE